MAAGFFFFVLLDLQYMHYLPGLTLGTSLVGSCLQLKKNWGEKNSPTNISWCQSCGRAGLTLLKLQHPNTHDKDDIRVFNISLPP